MAYTGAATTTLAAPLGYLSGLAAASSGLEQVGQQRLVSVLGLEELLDREAVRERQQCDRELWRW
jgi:hypothetical protein